VVELEHHMEQLMELYEKQIHDDEVDEQEVRVELIQVGDEQEDLE
jgi:hypothetical protein